MIRLLKMDNIEYREFREIETEDYAEAIMKISGCDYEEGMIKSEDSFNELLPNGLETENSFIMKIFEDEINEAVGSIWYLIREKSEVKELFIASLRIYDQYQRKGYGRATMNIVEEEAKKVMADKIALHVFGFNKKARALYEEVGYEPFSIGMEKILVKNV